MVEKSRKYCITDANEKVCCIGTERIEAIDGKIMCVYGNGRMKPAEVIGKGEKLDFNPFHHKPFFKIAMIGMYILIPVFAILAVWYITIFNSVRPKLLSMIFFVTILYALNSAISILYMYAKGSTHRIDRGWFDAWTFTHLSRDVLLPLVFYYFGVSLYLSVLFSVLFAISFEVLEYFLLRKYWYNFGAEENINHVSDVVVSIIGAAIFVFLVMYLNL